MTRLQLSECSQYVVFSRALWYDYGPLSQAPSGAHRYSQEIYIVPYPHTGSGAMIPGPLAAKSRHLLFGHQAVNIFLCG